MRKTSTSRGLEVREFVVEFYEGGVEKRGVSVDDDLIRDARIDVSRRRRGAKIAQGVLFDGRIDNFESRLVPQDGTRPRQAGRCSR